MLPLLLPLLLPALEAFGDLFGKAFGEAFGEAFRKAFDKALSTGRRGRPPPDTSLDTGVRHLVICATGGTLETRLTRACPMSLMLRYTEIAIFGVTSVVTIRARIFGGKHILLRP